MARVLIVEDEMHIAEGLRLNLSLKGHEVALAANGVLGLEEYHRQRPDLIILDLMMPKMDGNEFLEKIRHIDGRLPVLILSAKDSIQDKVKMLRQGVDDYMAKPFDLEEFLLRVERLLLRNEWSKENAPVEEVISFGSNRVDLTTGKAATAQGEVQLTEQEIRLLKVFYQMPNVPLDRSQILGLAWGYNSNTSTRTLDNFIVRFRKYFEENSREPQHFISVRAKGYLFRP
jgi:two-component system alkaline phosphatase synthesis response regulator PhoP